MRKLVLSITTAASIAAFTTPLMAQDDEMVELTTSHQTVIEAAGAMLLAAANSKLEEMVNLTPGDIITGDMVRAAVRGKGWGTIRGISRAAREEVFDQFQCTIFTHFPNPESECNLMLGYEAPHLNERYTDVSRLPSQLPAFSREMRQLIFGVGRTYLKSPENLRAVYELHVDVAVDEFNTLFFEGQQEFRLLLQSMLTAVEESRNNESQDLLEAATKARRELSNISDRDSTAYQEARAVLEAAESARDNVIADIASLEFINRRYVEGGPDLVTAYEEIFRDMLSRISTGN